MIGLCLIVTDAATQPFRKEVYAVPMTAFGTPLAHPFTGGFYNPMHQFVDIDADGDYDLFLLDISDGTISFYRNTGTPQNPLLRYEPPPFTVPPISGWFRFADLNGDGLIDLMSSGDSANSMAIYRNTGTPQLADFTPVDHAVRDSSGRLVVAETYSIASFADIDGDGDLDFFSLNSGVGTINFYQNTGSSQNFHPAFRTDRWQNIQICIGCGTQAVMPGSPTLHGNGTTYFGDVDGDHDLDMFYGDNFDQGLFFYKNVGTPAVPVLDSVSGRFPAAHPVITGGFNQPTLVDIDGDHDLDLFVSVLHVSALVNNFWLYRNTGDSVSYEFTLETTDVLPTFDVGFQSAPAFADIDGDGDQDLFVGNLFGPTDGFAHVTFLENTGTPTEARYIVADTGFVNSQSGYAYAPRFADIDGDGDLDLFVGQFAGSIEFYRNNGTPTVPVFQREISWFDSLHLGNYPGVDFFDADGDGDQDMFVGRFNGRIAMYRNVGTPQAFLFQHETDNFQDIAVGFNAKPQFADYDGDGDRDLLVGTSEGKLYLYRNDGPVADPVFTLVTDAALPGNHGVELVPAIVDIDNDGDPDIVLGSYKGGLEFFRNLRINTAVNPGSSADGHPSTFSLSQNFPNPFNPSTTIRFFLPERGHARMEIVNVLGQLVAVPVDADLDAGAHDILFDARALASGVYWCSMYYGTERKQRMMVLLR